MGRVELQIHLERLSGRAGEGERVATHRYSAAVVRELTPREIEQQRRLVQISLAPPRIH